MLETLDPIAADEVYAAALSRPAQHHPAAGVRAARPVVRADRRRLELTRAADVVVRRRSDDVEELRVPVPVADDAPAWLALVRDDLASYDPEGFRESWGIA